MTISVVIPTYNGARHIEQAILSVLAQQRQPDEILVCDDNSSDGTLELCERYRDRLTISMNPYGPSGFVNSWNKAIAAATGDYISILHQDDMLAPEFLRMAEAALERNAGVRHLFCTCRYIDEKGEIVGFSLEGPGGVARDAAGIAACMAGMAAGAEVCYTGLEYVTAYQQQGRPHIHRCPGVLTHRSIFEQCRYEPLAGHIADDDFFYRVGMYTDVIGMLTPMASYRVHGSSVTGRLDDAGLVGRLMDDYLYQCRQWKGHPFPDAAAYTYFVRNARKHIRRFIGYGLQQKRIDMILRGIKQWGALWWSSLPGVRLLPVSGKKDGKRRQS